MIMLRVVFILILYIQCIIAENKIIYFNGGNELIDISFQNRLFSEADIGSLNFGNTNNSSILTAGQFRANPAVLGLYKSSVFSIDMNPGFDFNGASLADMILGEGEFDKTINEALISGLEGSGMAGDDLFDDENNFIGLNAGLGMVPLIGQRRSINGASVIITPSEYGSLGISHRKLYDLNISFLAGGIELTIEDEGEIVDEGAGVGVATNVKLPLKIDMDMNLGINFTETDFGYGIDMGQIFKDSNIFGSNSKLTMGMGLNYLSGEISNTGLLIINGMIRQISEQSDITAYFNDPSTSFRNTLNDSTNIDFTGYALRPTFGLSYNRGGFNFDFSYLGNALMSMDGTLYFVTHSMGALDMGFDEDGADDILGDDLNTEGIDESEDDEVMFDMYQLKPTAVTYTNRIVYRSSTLEINYPTKIAFSIGYKSKSDFFKMVIGIENDIGQFSILHEVNISEDGEEKEGDDFITYCPEEGLCDIQSEIVEKSYKIIAEQSMNVKLGLGFGSFYLGGSIAIGDFQIEGLLDEEGKQKEPMSGIPLGGTFGMGFNWSLTENMAMDISLLSFPGLAGFTTLTYTF